MLVRTVYRRANLSGLVARQVPDWLIRFFVDVSSVAMGHGIGALHSLPEKARAQTVLDYKRTSPGVYHLPNGIPDLTPHLPEINVPTLVIWGTHDQTLAPASFSRLVELLPRAKGEALSAWHVPHQTNAAAFKQLVMKFLKEIKF